MKNRLVKKLTALTLCLVLLFAVSSPAFATVGKVYKTTVQGVRLRKAPVGGTGHEDNIIKSLPTGTKVVHLSSKGNWWYVRTAGGIVGYVFNSNLTLASGYASTIIKAGNTYTVKASSLVVRKSASTGSKRLGSLKKGASVKVLAVKNGWAKISKNGKTGYVKSKYLG